MAKGSKTFVPGLSGSIENAAQEIIRLLDESRCATHMSTYSHFTQSLAIWQAALNQVQIQEWLTVCAGVEHGLTPLSKALGVLVEAASHTYQDILGPVYMLLSQGDKRMGQYFSPYTVAKLMADMNFSTIKPREPGQAPIKMLEPSCGSGVMILAAAEAIEERCPGMIARGEIQFFGIDLDPVCVSMCQLNMHLHGIGRVVKVSDELMEEEQATITSMGKSGHAVKFAFQSAKVVCGNTLDPEVGKLFAEENPWIPFIGWKEDGLSVSPRKEASDER